MPVDLTQLGNDLTGKQDAIDQVLSAAEKEDRQLTADEATQLDTLEKARDEAKTRIDAHQKLREARARHKSAAQFLKTPLPRLTDAPAIGEEGERFRVPALKIPLHEPLRHFRGPDAEERAYISAQFFLAALWKDRRAAQWCEHNGVPVEWSPDPDRDGLAMGGGQNTKGGYLVPTVLSQVIIDLRERYGVARANCRVWPMSSDAENVPRRTGGVTAYFVGENAEITASDKSWDQVGLVARKLAALCKYSSEIAEDAILNMADDLASEIAYAFAVKEDDCFVKGDGTSTYGGITGLLTAVGAGSVATAATGETAFGTLTLASFEKVIGMLPEYPGIQPKWLFHKAGWAAGIKRLVDAAGGVTATELVNGVPQREFLGYPVLLSGSCNSTLTAQASTRVSYFGDYRLSSTLGSRRELRIDASKDRYFELDQLAIRGTERMDIVNHDCGSASAAGAVVALSTGAAS